ALSPGLPARRAKIGRGRWSQCWRRAGIEYDPRYVDVSRLQRSTVLPFLTQRLPAPARQKQACRGPRSRWANFATRLRRSGNNSQGFFRALKFYPASEAKGVCTPGIRRVANLSPGVPPRRGKIGRGRGPVLAKGGVSTASSKAWITSLYKASAVGAPRS